MTVLTLELFLTIFAIFIGVFLAITLFIGALTLSSLNKMSSSLTRIESITNNANKSIVINNYEKESKLHNPATEKDRLMKKLKEDTITKEEAKKLKAILEREKEEAENIGNFGLFLAILGVIALLAWIIGSRK